MIAVADVEKASQWYQHVLGAASGHGGAEYEQLLVNGAMILQLHRLHVGHHHGAIADGRSGSVISTATSLSSPTRSALGKAPL
jgi:catechol-2,3-dioxygenase